MKIKPNVFVYKRHIMYEMSSTCLAFFLFVYLRHTYEEGNNHGTSIYTHKNTHTQSAMGAWQLHTQAHLVHYNHIHSFQFTHLSHEFYYPIEITTKGEREAITTCALHVYKQSTEMRQTTLPDNMNIIQ